MEIVGQESLDRKPGDTRYSEFRAEKVHFSTLIQPKLRIMLPLDIVNRFCGKI